jgi:uncharacterized membrane protein
MGAGLAFNMSSTLGHRTSKTTKSRIADAFAVVGQDLWTAFYRVSNVTNKDVPMENGFPPIEHLERLEKTQPGSLKRIMDIADELTETRRRTASNYRKQEWFGLYLAFFLSLAIMAIGTMMVTVYHHEEGVALIIADILALTAAAIYRNSQRNVSF